MVKHLLALITRRRDPVVDAANTESENNRLIKSVTQTLARLLNPPSHSNLESPSNQSPSPRSLTHVVTPENETSSPQRRRKNQPNIPSSSSPRKGADSKRHTHKEKVNTTSHEKKALQILFNKNELTNVSQTPSREVNETASANSSHSEESSESLVESIASLESDNRSVNTDATEEALNEWAQEAANEIDDIMMTVGDFGAETDMTNNEIHERARKLVMEDSVEENNTITFLDKPKDQDEMLKKNNSQRRDLNRNCIKNQFEVGRKKLKNIVKERQLERSKLERKVKVIYDSVAFFRKHQEKEMTNLDDRTNSIEADQAKEPKSWETGLATTLSMFDVTAYRNESNN